MQKLKQLCAVLGLAMLSIATGVQAAVPEGVEDAFTNTVTDALVVVGYAWVAFIAWRGALLLFPIVSKILSRVFGR